MTHPIVSLHILQNEISESPQEAVDVVVFHPDSTGNSPVVVIHTETLYAQHQTATCSTSCRWCT